VNLRGRKWQEASKDCIMRSFYNLYASPNIVWVIKMMRWVGHVAYMENMRNAYNIFV